IERRRLLAAWNRAAAESPRGIHDPSSATKLHFDAAVQLAAWGVALVGWANSGHDALRAVDLVQVGGTVRRLSDEWVAMDRPDVIASLGEEGTGAASDQPGYFVAVALAEPVATRLVYLAATFADGRVRRCVLDPAPSPSET